MDAASSGAFITTLTVPFGNPTETRISPSSRCVPGQISDALRTTLLPQASGQMIDLHPENERRVPGRDGEADADRLSHRKREAARFVGWQDLTGNAGGHSRRLPHDALGEMDVESGPCFRRTRLVHHRGDRSLVRSRKRSAAREMSCRRTVGPV